MAQSSRFLRIDEDVLLEFIYHDQDVARVDDVKIENDTNGSQLKYLNTVDGDNSAQRFLINELGIDTVEFTATVANGFVVINNFASRQLLLKNGKTYKFDLSDSSIDNITGFNITGGGSGYLSGQTYVYEPTSNGNYRYEYTDLAGTSYIGGEIEVSNKSNSMASTPQAETGNDIKTAPGQSARFYAVPTGVTGQLALLDNTLSYLDSTEWQGTNSTGLTLVPNTTVEAVWYDTIRLHLRTGYSFSSRGYDGFLFQTKAKRGTDVYNYFNSTVYLNYSNFEIQNPTPFILGDTSYSKYVEIKVPSIVEMYTTTRNLEFQESFFGPVGSTDALIPSANYEFDFKLIANTFTENGYDYIQVVEGRSVVLPQEDEFTNLAANIEHATDGDYFNIFGTVNGSADLFESYITERINTSSDDITVFYEVQVSEQLGLNYVNTFVNTFTQTSNYDVPIVFRPVVVNSSISNNFIISVNMRIYNETDNTQILKTASLLYTEPKKYGKNMLKLNLNSSFAPDVIYNTLPNTSVNTELNSFINSIRPSVGETKYVPVALDTYGIVASNTKMTVDGAEVAATGTLAYETEGDATITLSKVSDNFIKFKIAKQGDSVLTDVSLVNAEDMVIIIKSGAIEERISHDPSFPNVDMGAGEVFFKIPKSTAVRFDQSSTNQFEDKFYINIKNGATESLLYHGKVNII